ncbi:MAG: SAM-dependent methyltransferase, partial [Flavobacterium sp.]
MSSQSILDQLKQLLSTAITGNNLIKVTLGSYRGNDPMLKNIYVRKVKIKRTDKLSFTYRYKTRDVIKNLEITDGIEMIANLTSHDFKVCNVFCIDQETYVEHTAKGVLVLRQKVKDADVKPSLTHNKEKNRIIKPSIEKQYLHSLQITDEEGKVYKNAQDKYRQINHYIDILTPLIAELPKSKNPDVVDMGSGKGYLTFALYDYLHNILNLDAKVRGVEFREDMVTLCNDIAKSSSFNKLSFAQGTIEDFNDQNFNILIALHACDTATDDAIFKGIKANADLIVVAPCCHKQVRREIEKSKAPAALSFLLKNGVFLERQAEMVTDGLRALILQHFGYKTKVMEF